MKDSDFKALLHPVGENVIATRGTAVSPGYKPDITVRSVTGSLIAIIESEQKTDRKAFLGDLVKAEMYAESQTATPELLIVMQSAQNTTTQQIANHLRPYATWLARKNEGRLSVSRVQLLSDVEYTEAIAAQESIGSTAFLRRGHLAWPEA